MKRWQYILLWLLFAPVLVPTALAFRELGAVLALRDPARAQQAQAEVIDVRSATGRRTTASAEVQYRFQVPGDPTWYSAADMTGRRELWVGVNREARAEARAERRIAVSYLPENPWVNAPVGQASDPVGDSVAGCVLLSILSLVWLVATPRRALKAVLLPGGRADERIRSVPEMHRRDPEDGPVPDR